MLLQPVSLGQKQPGERLGRKRHVAAPERDEVTHPQLLFLVEVPAAEVAPTFKDVFMPSAA